MGSSMVRPSGDMVETETSVYEPPCSGDNILRVDRLGVWSYGGAAFLRKEMVCLFASCLHCDCQGKYVVALPNEPHPVPVEIEDVPFLAVEVFSAGIGQDQVLSFRTNVDRIVTLDAEHPLYLAEDPQTGEQVPYIVVSPGISARISRPVYYELVALGEVKINDDKEDVGIWSSRQFFVLGTIC